MKDYMMALHQRFCKEPECREIKQQIREAEQELHQTNLADRGQTGNDQIDGDEQDEDDRDETAQEEQQVHGHFQRSELLFHG